MSNFKSTVYKVKINKIKIEINAVDKESLHFLWRILPQSNRFYESYKHQRMTDVRFTESLSVKAKEHFATIMASITPSYATSQSNRNHRLLETIKSNHWWQQGARRDLSCRNYFGRWNKMPSFSRHGSWKFHYFIRTG